ncbi:hypothetical protein ACJ5ZS_10300 [Aeromonas salmonicida]|uniref:hypothetical protein n=1 Tax=Aeromonas salmonicida TaxID=645 RepID=UPI000AAAA1F0
MEIKIKIIFRSLNTHVSARKNPVCVQAPADTAQKRQFLPDTQLGENTFPQQ